MTGLQANYRRADPVAAYLVAECSIRGHLGLHAAFIFKRISVGSSTIDQPPAIFDFSHVQRFKVSNPVLDVPLSNHSHEPIMLCHLDKQ